MTFEPGQLFTWGKPKRFGVLMLLSVDSHVVRYCAIPFHSRPRRPEQISISDAHAQVTEDWWGLC